MNEFLHDLDKGNLAQLGFTEDEIAKIVTLAVMNKTTILGILRKALRGHYGRERI